MRIPPRMTRIGAAGALVSALLLGGTAVAATPAATAHPAAVHTATVHIKSVGSVCYSKLPSQAHDTLDLIDKGGPFPYPKDGTVFDNREGVLPSQSKGYYHEYTVVTPGSPDRGARRIVAGEKQQEDYYTADHYATFNLVDFGC
ncbi:MULTISPECIES: ribonuclease [unclassified Streptomyces]|uniref:ribonuclease n=1 Tax=unclassified Streptomyces TaxID=2593676 RepID=UPI000C26F173|nr:ribonuclease [Streptomyces sp. CB02959]PJN37998.1 ribonuclease [Streptomyces sp. CB02959]